MDITGKNKAKILAALYNASKPQGMGFFHYTPEDMTEEEAAGLLKDQDYFDYLKGRVMKIYLGDNELDLRLYNRDNGAGAGEKALEGIV